MLKMSNWMLALVAFSFGILVTSRAQNRAVSEAEKPFTPSRLEWLALETAVHSRIELTKETQYQIDFEPDLGDDSIIIFVRYLPGANRRGMDLDIERAKLEIRGDAQRHGWSSWVRIKEDVNPAK